MFKKLILGNENHLQRKIVLWNMIASTLAAVQSAIMLVIVTRTIGLEDAGIFTLAYSIAQMMMTIGYFDMRSFQVTDVKDELPFKYYLSSRIITCGLMIVVSMIYILGKHYTGYKALIIFLACLFKLFDAFEDVIHALFQKRGRLDIAGKLQSIRFIVIIVVFGVLLIVTKNLVIALVAVIIVSMIIVGMNFVFIPYFDQIKLNFSYRSLWILFKACLPLFIGSYLALYMENSPKYAIDMYLTAADQAYYGMLAMTAFVVNLFSGFAFRPMLTPLALRWADKKYNEYLKIIVKLLLWVIFLTIAIAFAAFWLGIPVLSLIYGENLSEFKWILVVIVTAGGINSFGTILYYALTLMRHQNWLLIGYVITAIAAYFIAPFCVRQYGLMGAACGFAVIVSIRSLLFVIIFMLGYRKRER